MIRLQPRGVAGLPAQDFAAPCEYDTLPPLEVSTGKFS